MRPVSLDTFGMKFLEGAPVSVECEAKMTMVESGRRWQRKNGLTILRQELRCMGRRFACPEVIKSYDMNHPNDPKIFRRGDVADADPRCRVGRYP